MTFGFQSGSKNFCKLLWVFCEVFVLHGYDWIHWVAKSCTTTAYRWLFRDSHPSLRTLWSAVIKSPKCSALGTTVPVRLLQDAFVIFVFKQISQFGSFEKCVSTLCSPELGSTFARGSIGSSWDDLEVSWLLALGFRKALLKAFHQPNSLWIPVANPAIHVMYRSVLLRVPLFLSCFRFLWIHAAGFPEALHSYFHFFLVLDFRWICWHQIRNPVMEMKDKKVKM